MKKEYMENMLLTEHANLYKHFILINENFWNGALLILVQLLTWKHKTVVCTAVYNHGKNCTISKHFNTSHYYEKV